MFRPLRRIITINLSPSTFNDYQRLRYHDGNEIPTRDRTNKNKQPITTLDPFSLSNQSSNYLNYIYTKLANTICSKFGIIGRCYLEISTLSNIDVLIYIYTIFFPFLGFDKASGTFLFRKSTYDCE